MTSRALRHGIRFLCRLVPLSLLAVALFVNPMAAPAGAKAVVDGRDIDVSQAAPDRTLNAAPAAGAADVATGVPTQMLGFSWDGPSRGEVAYRVLADGHWGAWATLADNNDEGPDATSKEHRNRSTAGPEWLGVTATRVQLRVVRGALHGLHVSAIRTEEHATKGMSRAGAASPYPAPGIIPRAAWSADESWRTFAPGCDGVPGIVPTIRFGVVHHTATSNNYAPQDSASIVRGVYYFHTHTRLWCDIGYNFLVDRYGQVFEGRYGGITNAVIGAQAGGFNSGSTGISLIGDFTASPPPAAMYASLRRVMAWKFAYHGVAPNTTTVEVTGDFATANWPPGTVVTLPTVIGHRDVDQTTCPGDQMYALLPRLRADLTADLLGVGSLDRVGLTGPGALAVAGWSLDPYGSDPTAVHVYVDGVFAAALTADAWRPDVAAAYPGYGAAHGYNAVVPAAPGPHQVCAYVLNRVGARGLGCVTAAVLGGAPVGTVDAAGAGPGSATVAGWALDPDTTQSIPVHVYVDGAFATAVAANAPRADVAAAYPGYGAAHGYNAVVAAGAGAHTVCAYGINVTGGGPNALLGCRTVTVLGGSPFGSVDLAAGGGGGVTVGGWAIDPDTAASIPVHVYLDGAFGTALAANASRPDVAAAYPGYGPLHGFNGRVAAAPGVHLVCVYAINVQGAGINPQLACRTVTV